MKEMNCNKIFSWAMLVGFIVGILYANTFVSDDWILNGGLSQVSLKEYQTKEIVLGEYFFSVLWVRVFPACVLLMFKNRKYTQVIILGGLLWAGILLGVFVTVSFLSLGIKGIIFCIIGLLPHMLLFIVAYYLLILYIWSYPRHRWNLSKTIVITLCMLCGIVVECNLSPMLLHWFIEIM